MLFPGKFIQKKPGKARLRTTLRQVDQEIVPVSLDRCPQAICKPAGGLSVHHRFGKYKGSGVRLLAKHRSGGLIEYWAKFFIDCCEGFRSNQRCGSPLRGHVGPDRTGMVQDPVGRFAGQIHAQESGQK